MYERAQLQFAHAGTIISFGCLLGLFLDRDGEILILLDLNIVLSNPPHEKPKTNLTCWAFEIRQPEPTLVLGTCDLYGSCTCISGVSFLVLTCDPVVENRFLSWFSGILCDWTFYVVYIYLWLKIGRDKKNWDSQLNKLVSNEQLLSVSLFQFRVWENSKSRTSGPASKAASEEKLEGQFNFTFCWEQYARFVPVW